MDAPPGVTIHMIRFNPDSYDCPFTGKRITGCFAAPNKDIPHVHVISQDRLDRRLRTLGQTIQEIIDHRDVPIDIPTGEERYKHVIPIELFYASRKDDGFSLLDAYKHASKKRKATV